MPDPEITVDPKPDPPAFIPPRPSWADPKQSPERWATPPPAPPEDRPKLVSDPEPDPPRRVTRVEYHPGVNWKSVATVAAAGLLLGTSVISFMNRHDISQTKEVTQQVKTDFEKERNAQHKVNGYFLESTRKTDENVRNLDEDVANANKSIQSHGKQLHSLQNSVQKISKQITAKEVGPKVDGALFAPSVGSVPAGMTASTKDASSGTPVHSHSYIYGMRPGPYAVWDNNKKAWLISVMENGVMNSYSGQVVSRTPDGNFLVHLLDQNQDVYIHPDGTWQR